MLAILNILKFALLFKQNVRVGMYDASSIEMIDFSTICCKNFVFKVPRIAIVLHFILEWCSFCKRIVIVFYVIIIIIRILRFNHL